MNINILKILFFSSSITTLLTCSRSCICCLLISSDLEPFRPAIGRIFEFNFGSLFGNWCSDKLCILIQCIPCWSISSTRLFLRFLVRKEPCARFELAQCTEPTGQQGVVLVPDGGGGLGQHSIYVVDGAHLQYFSISQNHSRDNSKAARKI